MTPVPAASLLWLRFQNLPLVPHTTLILSYLWNYRKVLESRGRAERVSWPVPGLNWGSQLEEAMFLSECLLKSEEHAGASRMTSAHIRSEGFLRTWLVRPPALSLPHVQHLSYQTICFRSISSSSLLNLSTLQKEKKKTPGSKPYTEKPVSLPLNRKQVQK